MYVRWMQFGTFEPIMRLHSHHGDRLPWEYPGQPETIATEFLKLRGRLVPTMYTLSRVAHDTGLPMARSMYLQWPQIEAAYNYRSQYTVGADMLVASVAAPGDPATIQMWVPPGEWVDFFTGEELVGPAEISRSVPLEHYAVFMRKGAILPLQPELLTSAYGPQDNLTLQVWPGADGEFDLYADEGRGFAYREGAYQWTPLRLESATGCDTLRIEATQGQNFPGALGSRDWQVEFMATEAPQSVRLNSAEISSGAGVPGWSYDASSRTLSVRTGTRPTNQATTVALDSGGCS
jgi:alpha-glucosidase (family GH31 glycosyl hydrolase)